MRFIEPLIHTMVWVIFFGFPLLMITNEGPEIDWVRILHHSIVPLFFCIVFYFNYFILIPRILFRNRIWIWCSVNLAVVLLLSILMQILHLGLIPPRPIYELPRFKLNPGILFFFRDFFSLILVIGVAVSVSLGHSWRKAEIARKEAERLRIEAEQGRTDAELKNLRNQLNPHFLLNTLNNIYALIAFDPDKAQTAVSELGRLLRYVLYDNRHEKISLGSEVSFIKDYIALMKIRLSPDVSLETEIDIPEESTTEISPMLFISLIENAFKHGISPSGRHGASSSAVSSTVGGRRQFSRPMARARLRTMAPSQPLKCSGQAGGMALQTAMAQSLRHSSTSRSSESSRRAIAAQ